MNPRGTPTNEKPFCWMAKRALESIQNSPAVSGYSAALAVYAALAWIASDSGSAKFKAEIPAIARKSGCCYRTVQNVIKELEAANVVHVDRPKIRAAATFTLLSLVRQPLPNVRQTNGGFDCRSPIDNKPNKPNKPNLRKSDGNSLSAEDWNSI